MTRFLPNKRAERVKREDLSGHLVTMFDPAGAASEAYRLLRTNLLYAFVEAPPKVIVMTSPDPLTGKSTVCANLGAVLAQASKSTLIMDCDLRRPSMHKFFGLRNYRGVVDILAEEHDLRDCEQPLPGLKVVPSGPVPPYPTELLGSRRFAQLVDDARRQFDYVLIDSSPTEMFSDATILAAQGDGVMLVLDAQSTSKSSARQAVHGMQSVGANVLGTIMNNVTAPKSANYYRYEG
jgi:capsular exopolysaccharide synthesis family protein